MTHSILDACCGSRMFWFDKQHPDCTFLDIRKETVYAESREGRRAIVIDPDIVGSFKDLPFPDDSFQLVVFDPPHLTRNGKTSWMAKKYGSLSGDWQATIQQGFTECFRVLKSGGTLVFKWNELDVPVSQILKLTPVKPLIGNRCGKSAKSHWIIFIKK